VDELYKLQAIKQIFPGDPAIMILIGPRVRISAKTLRDKGYLHVCKACNRRSIKCR
jgi:hypothetical protein